jgi:GrpB-like predicted nucleotidyltransferase (UPF0157 family)
MGGKEGHSPRLDAAFDRVVIGSRQPGPVTLVKCDPMWPTQFEALRAELAGTLGPLATGIEHVGSTAVPHLAAKPIIDVLVTVESIDPDEIYAAPLAAIGYELRVREPGHRMFRPATRDVHVHVWAEGSQEAEDYVLLRNRLRASPADRDAYEALKRELARHDWPDVNYYAEAKSPMVRELLARARAAR